MRQNVRQPTRRKWLLTLPVVAAWWATSTAVWAEAGEPQRFRFQQTHMGMLVELTLYAANEQAANAAAQAAFERFAQLDSILSDYKPESELSRLSATAGSGTAVKLSDDLWFVLSRAQRLARDTGGAFDVTVGPLTKMWRSARRAKEFPPSRRLVAGLVATGYESLVLDEAAHTAMLLKPGMRLDLGGIAAGYAVDEALKVLRERGYPQALVDASGDIAVGDPPPGKQGWRLGIMPEGGSGPPTRWLILANAAVTTSGDAYQFVEIEGKRYSHIVDPRTGLGLTTRMSATIVAPDCITADSVATAVCVSGPERGLAIIERDEKLSALITIAGDPTPGVIESKRFAQHVER
jgi:thiamine biosynthesis lipoprotein